MDFCDECGKAIEDPLNKWTWEDEAGTMREFHEDCYEEYFNEDEE